MKTQVNSLRMRMVGSEAFKSRLAWIGDTCRRGAFWLTPLFVFEVIRHGESKAIRLIEFAIAACVLAVLLKKPPHALSALIIGLPFSTIVLAALLRIGLPASVVRALGFWKEAIVAGAALATLRYFLNNRQKRFRLGKPDRSDRLVLAYVGLGSLYLLVPGLFVGSGPGSSLSFYTRELGWRGDILYVGIFVIIRHCGLSREDINRAFNQFVGVSAVVAAVGVFEFFATSTWVHFITKTLRLADYDYRVLRITYPNVQETYGSIGGHHFPRIGSVLLNYLDAGFYLAMALAIAVELFTRGRPSWLARLSLPLISVALVFNQGRAALVAGVIAVVLGLRKQIGRSVLQAERLGFGLVIALLVLVPLVATSGLAHRFVHSQSSNNGHIAATKEGLRVMSDHPLGTGLATGAGSGQLAALKGLETTQTFLVTEDQYLNIGVQLGYIGIVLYGLALLYMLRSLRRGPPVPGQVTVSGPAFGARNGLIGLLMASLVLQPFTSQIVAWTVFAICGAGAAALDSWEPGEMTRQRHSDFEGQAQLSNSQIFA